MSKPGQFVFRFRKDCDNPENRDLAATYLAALLSPDPILGRPQSTNLYENTREITGTTGWACEQKSQGGDIHYQLGRSNDFLMSTGTETGAWRVSHRYFDDEALAAARTLFFRRFSRLVEDAGKVPAAA